LREKAESPPGGGRQPIPYFWKCRRRNEPGILTSQCQKNGRAAASTLGGFEFSWEKANYAVSTPQEDVRTLAVDTGLLSNRCFLFFVVYNSVADVWN
jgi:hypothetical protein